MSGSDSGLPGEVFTPNLLKKTLDNFNDQGTGEKGDTRFAARVAT